MYYLKLLKIIFILVFFQLPVNVSLASQKLDISEHISIYEVVSAKCSGYDERYDPCKGIIFVELSKHAFFGSRGNSIFLVKWTQANNNRELLYEANLISENEVAIDNKIAVIYSSSDDIGSEMEIFSLDSTGNINGYIYKFTHQNQQQQSDKVIEFVLKLADGARLQNFLMKYPSEPSDANSLDSTSSQ